MTQIPASLPLLCQGGTEDKVNLVLGDVHRSRSDPRDLDAVVQGSEHFEASDPQYFVYEVTSNPSEEASIKIDYRLPVRRVYEKTTISLMQKLDR